MSLRVAYVIDDLGVGGAQRQLSRIAPALAPDVQVSVHCISSGNNPLAEGLRDAGIPVHIYSRRPRWSPRFLSRLSARMRADRTHMAHGWLDASNVYAAWTARYLGIPSILSLRSDRLQLHGVRRWLLARELRRARYVTANSRSGARCLIDSIGVPEARVAYVPNFVDVRRRTPLQPRADGDARPRRALFVGRLVPSKRVDVAIAALARARKTLDVRLVVVGDGPERAALGECAAACGVGEWVEFRGALDDVASEMPGVDCVVLPSEFEGTPNAVLEALAWGIPVVARNVGDLPEIVADGQTGVLLDSNSVAQFAAGVVRALTDDNLRRTAAARGPEFVENFHHPDHVRRVFCELYGSAYEKREGGGLHLPAS